MKNQTRSILISSVLAVSASQLQADTFLRFGLDFGGEKLGELEFTDGTSDSLYAASGFYAELGFGHQTPVLENPNLETEISIGYKHDSTDASNLSISFSRFTTSLTQYLKVGDLRFGAGVTGHFRNKLSVSSPRDSVDDMVNNSYGLSVVADYRYNNQLLFGIKAVSMDYENYGESADANSFGIFMSSEF